MCVSGWAYLEPLDSSCLIMNRALLIAASAVVCFGVPVHAQVLTEALLEGKVQQSFDGERVASCGVVISGMELSSARKALMFNGSFAVYDPPGGVVKGGASEVDVNRIGSADASLATRRLQIDNVWLKGQGAPRTTVAEGTDLRKGDDPLFILYNTGLKPLFGLLESIRYRQPIQIGLRVVGRDSDQVLFGVVALSDAQHAQLAQCVLEWTDAMKEKYKPKK